MLITAQNHVNNWCNRYVNFVNNCWWSSSEFLFCQTIYMTESWLKLLVQGICYFSLVISDSPIYEPCLDSVFIFLYDWCMSRDVSSSFYRSQDKLSEKFPLAFWHSFLVPSLVCFLVFQDRRIYPACGLIELPRASFGSSKVKYLTRQQWGLSLGVWFPSCFRNPF